MKTIHIQYALGRRYGLGLTSLALGLFALQQTFVEDEGERFWFLPFWFWYSLLAICFTALALLIFRRPAPALILSPEGLMDYTRKPQGWFIPWDQVEKVRLWEIAQQKLVVITLRDAQNLDLQSLSAIQRSLAEHNLKAYGSPLVYNTNQLGCGYRQLIDWVEGYIKA